MPERWTFRITNEPNGQFEILNSVGSPQLHGQAAPRVTADHFSAITGGSATTDPSGRIRVLVAFDDGRVGLFVPSTIAGLLEFDGFI
jgi:hypothetical protein